MKKKVLGIVLASALVLTLGLVFTGPAGAVLPSMSVSSDTSVLVTGVYNKGVSPTNFVDLSGSPMNALEAYEPNPYPSAYPGEPPETTNSTWDTYVNWSFQTNAPNADWIWETHLANDPSSYDPLDPLYDAAAAKNGRVVLFEKTFIIPGNPTSATLHIAVDNAYEFWFDSGTHTRSATAAGGAGWELTDLKEANVATSGWQSVGHYNVVGALQPGVNKLYILAGNEYYWTDDGNNGDPVWYNPGAAIFQIDIEYEEEVEVYVDIKPTSCPNPLNVNSKGVLPVAILGTEDFNVSEVNPATVELEGVSPLRYAYKDVAAPFLGEPSCEDEYACTTDGPDGYLDLTLKFDTQAVVAALGEVDNGDIFCLTLTGELFNGTPISGSDVIRIIKKR